jgi:K+-sensing histidine kinase KdpD
MIWGLGILTCATLLLQLPDGTILQQYQALMMIYALLTALAIYFSPVLPEGEISSAHAIGMIAALSLPEAVQPATLWAVAFGSLAGGLAFLARTSGGWSSLRHSASGYGGVVILVAQVTLSFFVATTFNSAIGGTVPIGSLNWDIASALIAFNLLYILIYFLIFLLRSYTDGHSIKRLLSASGAELITILALPIPFALLGAEVFGQLSSAAFVILIAGLTLTLVGQYGISRAQYQLRKQVDELRSLSVVSQVVSANLNLDALLNMVYLQLSQLLDVENFLVALYADEDNHLEYPLVIRAGQPVKAQVKERHGGLLDHVLQKKEALLVTRDVQFEAGQIGLLPPMHPVESWLGVPLMSGGRLLGAMVVTSDTTEHQFSPEDLRLLNIVAASASIAIENAQLYRQQTDRVDEMARLNNILALLTGTLSPETVLDTVISSASTLSDASAVAVHLFWDEAGQTLALVRSAGLSDQFSKDPPDPLLPIKSEAHDFSQQPLVVNDANTDDRAAHLRGLLATEGKQAWIELPLAVGGMRMGIITLYYNDPQIFNTERIELLRAFANQVAQAIRNARQFEITDVKLERHLGQLLALAAIGHELTATIDEDEICALLLDHALQETNTTIGAIILLDRVTNAPRIVHHRGNLTVPGAHPLMGAIFHQTKPVLTSDITAESRYTHLSPTTRSQLLMPILRNEKTMGLIVLESNRNSDFGDDDVQFVMQIANQAVIALDNSRLFQRISEARDRLQVILDAMSEAILMIDREGVIALANPRMDIIGLLPEQLVSRTIDDVLEQPDLDLAESMGFNSDQEVRKLVKEIRFEKGWTGYEPHSYTLQLEPAIYYVQRQIVPVHDNAGQIMGVMLVFYDETEERALDKAREDLSNMIIHDLRSPLMAVTTSLKLLSDMIPADNDLKPVVQTTAEAGRRAVRKLLSRVDSLLDIARMESGQLYLDLRSAELATLVDSVCIELSPLAHELNVMLSSKVPDDLPALSIDADKVERLLLNLLDNALKFSPTVSSVTISTHQPDSNHANGRFVRVDVIDQGPGVPDEYKERLFDRFTEIRGRVGRRRGSGLGLTFCRLVVEAHGGDIWIEDNPQGGSIFSFTLPLAPEKDTKAVMSSTKS